MYIFLNIKEVFCSKNSHTTQLINKNKKKLNTLGCELSSHAIDSCPIFFYRYRNQYVHSKINQSKKDFRKNFKRRTPERDDRYKTLSNLHEMIEIAEGFANDNNSLISILFNDLDADEQSDDLGKS
jgi:hypothetical protein